jgi:hypothetical protein
MVEATSFWFVAPNELIVRLANRFFPSAKRYLEIGCGKRGRAARNPSFEGWERLPGSICIRPADDDTVTGLLRTTNGCEIIARPVFPSLAATFVAAAAAILNVCCSGHSLRDPA